MAIYIPNQQGGTLMKTHTQLVKRFFAALLLPILVLVFPNSPAADSFEDATQAYESGDYEKRLEKLMFEFRQIDNFCGTGFY